MSKDKKKHAEEQRRWAAKHPDYIRANVRDQQAKKLGAFVESVSPLAVFERDGGICQICYLPIGDQEWHVDHIMPFSLGGSHSYANTQLAHSVCNLKKGEGPLTHKGRKTHCPHGHEYSEINTYVNPNTGYRVCRTCAKER